MNDAHEVSREAKILHALGDWSVAYTVAVLAGSVVFFLVCGAWLGTMLPLWMIPVVAAFMALFGLPGFVLLRVGLHVAKVGSIFAFAAAGGANAAAFLALFSIPRSLRTPDEQGVVMASLCVAGAASGAIYRLVERKAVPKKEVLA